MHLPIFGKTILFSTPQVDGTQDPAVPRSLSSSLFFAGKIK